MPEVSTAALERELSKLTTKEFFEKVTNQDLSDPAAVIESLEPLLEALDAAGSQVDDDSPQEDAVPSVAPELVRFLEGSPISVRLLLWQRLREAYVRIDYQPMVVCCYLRMIGMILEEMKSESTSSLPRSERLVVELKSIRLIFDLVKKLYETVHSAPNALECVDDGYLKFAVSNFGEILQLLQVVNIHEDSMRVGQLQPPFAQNGLPMASFKATLTLTHETQIRIWLLLYAFFREAIAQNKELFPTPLEDRFDFLRTTHRNLGIRGMCGSMNRTFVRTLKDEFFQMTHVEGYDSEQAQVLYDLYGLNCFLNPSYELIEHHCTHDAFIDRGVAQQAVDMLLLQASKLPIKELIKHPLKDTIEKVHGVIVKKKPTETIVRNREIIRTFLKSVIYPLDLFQCLKGEGNQLPLAAVPESDAILAAKGWYFLMGHMALTKFRSQKRTGPTATEDIDIAIAFFNQDLEFTGERWETWFRLGQAFDTKIEESVVWSAEKLNSNMQDLVTLQKNVIHCYTMATALAYRSADLQFETSSKMTELYHDFALRLYASSREPFSMKPFELEDTEVFVSRNYNVEKQLPYQPLRMYTVWRLAKTLFQRAQPGRPDHWQLQYMIGKCLWKMHSADEKTRAQDVAPSGPEVLSAFVKALELLPERDKKESRDKREPVLEPHYKLAAIVHKLVTRGSISHQQAKEAMEHSWYARKETFPDDNPDDWVPYILRVLKHLRSADKSNWYHRIIVRHAHIVYDDHDSDEQSTNMSLLAAKEVLTAQMFTKTMVLQVWRPENERAGRHFVYTSRYTRFFTRILRDLKDRQGLEMLARRVRRRQNDLFEHSTVWHEICTAYLALLRKHAGLPEGLETSTFSNIAHEDFLARKEPLEKWMLTQEPGVSSALDVLREVQELKKVNMSLMKPGVIDDLIGDAYAYLFITVGKQLHEQELEMKREEESSRPALSEMQHSPSRNPMMSLSHLMNVDGASDAPPAARPLLPGSAPVNPVSSLASMPDGKEIDPVPVRRKIGVGRREIRTCAESCFQKAGAQKDSKSGPSKSGVQSVIDRERQPDSGITSVETSAPGSVHDGGDEDSELSELEEEPRSSPMPELAARRTFPKLAPTASAENNADDEGDRYSEETADNADGEDIDMGDEEDGDDADDLRDVLTSAAREGEGRGEGAS